MGLRQLAYGINKRNTGVYYSIEFQSEAGEFLPKMELAMKRDERILRFLTVRLDKYGVKYNDDKRNGKIGKRKEMKKKSTTAEEI
jgi:small subunit ribosomal protein S6